MITTRLAGLIFMALLFFGCHSKLKRICPSSPNPTTTFVKLEKNFPPETKLVKKSIKGCTSSLKKILLGNISVVGQEKAEAFQGYLNIHVSNALDILSQRTEIYISDPCSKENEDSFKEQIQRIKELANYLSKLEEQLYELSYQLNFGNDNEPDLMQLISNYEKIYSVN